MQIITFVMFVGSVPYLALQFRAVFESARVLSGRPAGAAIHVGFTFALILFAVLLGVRRASPRQPSGPLPGLPVRGRRPATSRSTRNRSVC